MSRGPLRARLKDLWVQLGHLQGRLEDFAWVADDDLRERMWALRGLVDALEDAEADVGSVLRSVRAQAERAADEWRAREGIE